MSGRERARVVAMYGSILALHALGLSIFFAFVLSSHYKGLGAGVGVLAYTLGLRHAFDADHISAIDNSTRKVLSEREGTGQPRPFGFGFSFSLGHSSVVLTIGTAVVIAQKTVLAAVSHSSSGVEQFGGVFGAAVSAAFLLLIGLLNLVVLAGIIRSSRAKSAAPWIVTCRKALAAIERSSSTSRGWSSKAWTAPEAPTSGAAQAVTTPRWRPRRASQSSGLP